MLHFQVAPARERGLKLNPNNDLTNAPQRRSREGAWIEIVLQSASAKELKRRSREGAWIEIKQDN